LGTAVGYWEMSEGGGSTLGNSVAGSPNGTLLNSPSWVTGPGGEGTYGVSFNGSNQYGRIIPDDALKSIGSGAFTVSSWVKATTAGVWYRAIFSNFGTSSINNFWGLGWMDSNRLGLVVRDNQSPRNEVRVRLASGQGLDGEWHHLVGVRDGQGTLLVYLDGELVATANDTVGDASNSRDILLARHTDHVNASIAGVGIWDLPLNAESVAALYQQTGEIAGGRLPQTTALRIGADGTFDMSGLDQTVGSLADVGIGGRQVLLGSGTLTTGGDDSSTTFAGTISGSGGLIKTGAGTVTLNGENTYAGGTTIDQGTLLVNGSITSDTTVNSGGTLGGHGTIKGNVTGDGTVAPGTSLGILTIEGDFVPTGTVQFEVNANYATAGTDYDQIVVKAPGTTVDLTGAEVTFVSAGGGTVPAVPNLITLIQNDTSNPTTGPFANYADGATVSIGLDSDARSFRIFYNGGDGHDVVLVSAATPAVVYVEDTLWNDLTPGTVIADADFGRENDQPAVFGVTAFQTINEALSAVAADGTIVVNGGAYSDSIALTGTQTLEITGSHVAPTVMIESLTTSAGQNVLIQGSSNLTIGDANDTTIAGVISGSGSLTKQGTGTLTVSGNNHFAGGTTVSQGVLRLEHTSAAGSGSIRIGDGTLSLYRSGETTTYANAITSLAGTSGTLTVDGSGSNAGTGTNSTYNTGTITVDGTLTVSRPTGGTGHTAFSSLLNGSGTLRIGNTNGGVAPSNSALGRALFNNASNGFSGAVQILGGGNFMNSGVASPSYSSVDIVGGGYLSLQGGRTTTVGSLSGAGNVTKNNASDTATLSVGSGAFSGVIAQNLLTASGTVAVTKTSVGTLTLSGPSTHTGTTAIQGGTLRLESTSAAGSGLLQIGDGTLSLYRSGETTTYANAITSLAGTSGTLTVDGSGSNAGNGPNSTYSTGTITVNGTLTVSRPTGGDGTTQFNGILAGNGSLIAAGTNGGVPLSAGSRGRLLFASGSNSFQGTVQVLSGANFLNNRFSPTYVSLEVADGGYFTLVADTSARTTTVGTLSGAGNIIRNAQSGSAILAVGNGGVNGSFSGAIDQSAFGGGPGNIALTKLGSGILTLAGASSFTGATMIDGGTLRLESTSAAGSSSIQVGNAVLSLFRGGSTTSFSNPIVSVAGTSGSLVVDGSGSDAGNDNNSTYSTGGIAVNGTLTISRPSGGSGTTAFNGVLSGSGTLVMGDTNGGVTISTSSRGRANFANGNNIFAGHVHVLANANFLNHTMGPSYASLQLDAGGYITLVSANGTDDTTVGRFNGEGSVIKNFTLGTARLVVGGANQDDAFSGQFLDLAGWGEGVIALTKQGTGIQTLTGENTYTGSTTVNGGTLLVNGSITSNTAVNSGATLGGDGTIFGSVTGLGTIAPGNSPGILTVVGTYAPTGTTKIEIVRPGDPPTAGNNYDQINVTGTVNLDGTLDLDFSGTGTIPDFQTYVIIANDETDAVAGTFANYTTNGGTFTADGRFWVIFYDGGSGNDVTLTTTTALTPATVYVSPTWSILTNGTLIADADFGSGGNQPAIFGFDAFASINAALAAVSSSGTIIVNSGSYAEAVSLDGTQTLQITGPDALQTVIINSLATAAGQKIIIQGLSNLTIGDANDATIGGVIDGSGSLTKQGAGTLTLSGNNSYDGLTTISAGTIRLGHDSALGSTAAGTVIGSDGTLDINARSIQGEAITVAGTITNTGGQQPNALRNVTLSGNATFTGSGRWDIRGGGGTLNLNGHTLTKTGNNYVGIIDSTVTADGGAVVVSQGTFSLTRSTWMTGSVTVNSNAILRFENNSANYAYGMGITLNAARLETSGNPLTINSNVALTGTNAFNVTSDLTATGDFSGSGGVNKTGGAALVLTGTNVYTGTTTLRVGILAVASSSSLGTGLLDFRADSGQTITFRSADTGTLTLANTLNMASNVVFGSASTGDLVFGGNLDGGGGAKTFTINNAFTTFNGTIVGTNSPFTKNGPGTMVFNGNNTYTKPTVVNAGTLLVNGSTSAGSALTVNNNSVLGGTGTIGGGVTLAAGSTSVLSPGSPVSTTADLATGSLTLNSGTTLAVQINGLTPDSGHDQVRVSGSVDLGGATLNTTGSTISGIVLGDKVVLIDNNLSDPVTGNFATYPQGSVVAVNGKFFRIFYNGHDGNDVVLIRAGDGSGGNVDVAFVNADWANVIPGEDPDGTGPAEAFLVDAYATIQDAINNVNPNGIIYVLGNSGAGYAGFNLDKNVQIRFIADYQNAAETAVTINGAVTLSQDADWVLFAGTVAGALVSVDGAPANLTTTADGTINGNAANTRALSLTSTTDGTGAVALGGVIGGSQTLSSATIGQSGHRVASIAVHDLRTAGTVSLNTSGAITQGTVDTGADVTAAALVAVAVTGIDLDTTVADAILSNTGLGDVRIDETDALNLLGLSVANGNAAIMAGGALTDGAEAVISVSGNAAFGGTSITLGDSANDAFNVGSLTFNSIGAVHITEHNDMALAGSSSGGDIVLVSTGAISDANGSPAVDITGSTLVMSAATGIGDGDAIETQVGKLEAVSTSGNVRVDNTGSLTIGGIGDLVGVNASAGSVAISATGTLNVDENVTASGPVLLSAVESGATDHLVVKSGMKVESTSSSVELQAGDDLTLADCSTVRAASTITLRGDHNSNDSAGSVMQLLGTLDAGAGDYQVLVFGGPQADTIWLNPGGAHTVDSIEIDGVGGDDTYHIYLGKLTGGLQAVSIADSGGSGGDRATVYATASTNADGDITPIRRRRRRQGGFVQVDLTPVEQVNYTGSLEFLTVRGEGGDDTFHVQPSRTTEITVNGGSPHFGEIVPPGGDTLDFDSFDNTFTLICGTILTNHPDDSGVQKVFRPVHYRSIENMPLDPLGKTEPLRFDMNWTAAAMQAGYTSVLPTAVYNASDPLSKFGWDAPLNGFDRGAASFTSDFANLLRDGHWHSAPRTFIAEVESGWYLVSVKTGDKSFARDRLRVTDANTVSEADPAGRVLLDNVSSPAGQIVERTFLVFVPEGKNLALTFANLGGDPYWVVNGIEIRPGRILTFGSPETDAKLTADGVTQTTFTGYQATPGALVTVDPQLDTQGDYRPEGTVTIVSPPDADPDVAGHQVRANDVGVFTYTIVHPSVAGTMRVMYAEVTGAQASCFSVDFVAPSVRRFDFNSGASPTQAPAAQDGTPNGYVGVLPTQLSSPAVGYGWVTAAQGFDRGALSSPAYSNLLRDGAWSSSPRDFRMQLPAGTYDVTVTFGDASFARDQMNVTVVTGSVVSDLPNVTNVATAAGQFVHRSFTASPDGGELVLRFSDGGGDPYWTVAGLEVRPRRRWSRSGRPAELRPRTRSAC
jgi:fibronectin-binding autotransporter adhesin